METLQKNEAFYYGFLQLMWPNVVTFTEEILNGKRPGIQHECLRKFNLDSVSTCMGYYSPGIY